MNLITSAFVNVSFGGSDEGVSWFGGLLGPWFGGLLVPGMTPWLLAQLT
jgi:hypothetical protein